MKLSRRSFMKANAVAAAAAAAGLSVPGVARAVVEVEVERACVAAVVGVAAPQSDTV